MVPHCTSKPCQEFSFGSIPNQHWKLNQKVFLFSPIFVADGCESAMPLTLLFSLNSYPPESPSNLKPSMGTNFMFVLFVCELTFAQILLLWNDSPCELLNRVVTQSLEIKVLKNISLAKKGRPMSSIATFC